MKTIYILIVSCISFGTYAQDPELFDDLWYLHNLIIDNEDNVPNSSLNASVRFFENGENPDEFILQICSDFYSGTLEFNLQETEFSILSCCTSGSEICGDGEYQDLYYGFYENNQDFPFTYILTNDGTNSSLEITANNGDRAIYGDAPVLEIENFELENIIIFPNPIQDQLFVNATVQLEKASIYTVNGKLVAEHTMPHIAVINTSDLSQGLFFITIEDIEGNKVTKKLVKK